MTELELEKILGIDAMQELRDLIREEVREELRPRTGLAKASKQLEDFLTDPVLSRDEPLDPDSSVRYDPYSEFERTEDED